MVTFRGSEKEEENYILLLEEDCNNFWCLAMKQPQGERFSLFSAFCSCRAKLRFAVYGGPGLPQKGDVLISLSCWTAGCQP